MYDSNYEYVLRLYNDKAEADRGITEMGRDGWKVFRKNQDDGGSSQIYFERPRKA